MFCVLLGISSSHASRADTLDFSPPLSLRSVEAWNRHDHGNTGASGARLESGVTLHLLPGGRVRIEDQGSREESDLFADVYRAKKTRWSHVWLGSFTQQKDLIVLNLERSKIACAVVATERNNARGASTEKKTACPDLPAKIQMQCQTAQIPVEAARQSPDQRTQTQAALRCSPSDGQVMQADTPTPWVFGKTACIETVNGPRAAGRIYRSCATSAASGGDGH